ncbi:hypothetical protein DESUT3_21300 [Desulfuromonas versatilis]|uniref:Uncharacterized protein n=1 Tax=Desulfuromonas versatilis TaxID=2802975 RepID=A0ABM8HWH0_9BACT|nr:hypothetical protein DESUT3_21300 [Desulfuromonas versatilis]
MGGVVEMTIENCCLAYIDLNMVRAGVVQHPGHWEHGGYQEIQNPRDRYGIIDHQGLMQLCGFSSPGQFRESYRRWVDALQGAGGCYREGCWTESVAVGNSEFVTPGNKPGSDQVNYPK